MKYIKSIISMMLVTIVMIASGININALELSEIESGIYKVQNDVSHESEIGMSMSRTYLDPDMKIKVKDGKAYYTIKFKGANYMKDHKIFVNGSSVNYDVISRDSLNHTLELGFSTNSIQPNIKASMYVDAMGRDVEFGIITKTDTLSLIEKIEEPKKEEVKTEVKEEVVEESIEEVVKTSDDKTSNNTMLYVGIGVIAVLVVGFFIMRVKK